MTPAIVLIAGLALEAVGPSPASGAQNDQAAGRVIAQGGPAADRPACASCHMPDGAGQVAGGIPRLAGLPAAYIEKQLGYFADGTRRNVFMQGFAKALSPAQRAQVAAYYAALPAPADDLSGETPDAALLGRGEALYGRGRMEAHVMPCMGCHGPTGAGLGTMFPAVAGQPDAYVAEQLDAWHGGAKRDPDSAMMLMEAKPLSADDIRALAAYIHALGQKGRSP